MLNLETDKKASLEALLGAPYALDGSFASLWAVERIVAAVRPRPDLRPRIAWVPHYLAELFARAFGEMGLTIERPTATRIRTSGQVEYEFDTAADFHRLVAPPSPFPTFYGTKWLGSPRLGAAIVPWYGLATVFLNHEWARTDHDMIGNQRDRMDLAVPWLVEEHVRTRSRAPEPRNIGQQLARDMVWPPLEYHGNDFGDYNQRGFARTIAAVGESAVRENLRGYAESQDESLRLLAARELLRLNASPQSRVEASAYRDAISVFNLEVSAATRLTVDALTDERTPFAELHQRIAAELEQHPEYTLLETGKGALTSASTSSAGEAPVTKPPRRGHPAETASEAPERPDSSSAARPTRPPREVLIEFAAGATNVDAAMRALMSHDGYFVPSGFVDGAATYGPPARYGTAHRTPPGELWVFTDRECADRAAAQGIALGVMLTEVPAVDWVSRLGPLGVQRVRINPIGSSQESWNLEPASFGLALAWARGLAFEDAVRERHADRIRLSFEANETFILPILDGRWMTKDADGVTCGCVVAAIDVWNRMAPAYGSRAHMVSANASAIREYVARDPAIDGLYLLGVEAPLPRIVLDTPLAADANDVVRQALSRGKKIEAVKEYRRIHSVGLKEAKDAVDHIEAAMGQGARPSDDPPDPAHSASARSASEDAIWEALARGKKIQAIKHYRQLHGVGLKEAKEGVERMQAQGMRRSSGEASHLNAGPGAASPEPTAQARESIAAHLQANKKIQAIKEYRQVFGCGLKEAKEGVERFEVALRRDPEAPLPRP